MKRTLAQHARDITIAMCSLAITVYVLSAVLLHDVDLADYR